jgi:pimeloyl-ACP methyl ester carboxylesterase
LANLADRTGCRLIHHDPAAALLWFRDAAAYAMFALAASETAESVSSLRAQAIARHNHAVEELLRCAKTGPRDVDPAWRRHLASVGVQVAPTTPIRAGLPCNELWIARDFRVKNLEHVGQDGLGVPLVAVSHFHNREAVPDRFFPERLKLPATAVFRPNGPLENGAWRDQPAVLALHDPAHESMISLGTSPGTLALAADLTTPMAHQFIKAPLAEYTWGGLLRPEQYTSAPGIFMQAPHQPGKIPVLFVHGLWSNPEAWLVMANRLQNDALIRDRYEFWYAFYPTGAPLMVSAVRLRRELHDLRAAIDPRHDDPALDQMVVVGHSLGGDLTKQLVQSSGQTLEGALFTRPFDQVQMSPESRNTLARMLYFEPVPSVRRAVFLCAPHHGSNTANRLIGRFSSMLVRRASDIEALHAEIIRLNGPEVLTPEYRRRPPSSIDNLKWDSPMLKALSELPISPDVPYHSIVATLVPNAPTSLWTDGVVSYESAHLDGAQSELVVRHNHFANVTPEATAEVHRILRLHLDATDSSGAPVVHAGAHDAMTGPAAPR